MRNELQLRMARIRIGTLLVPLVVIVGVVRDQPTVIIAGYY